MSNEVDKDHPVQVAKEESKDFPKHVCNDIINNNCFEPWQFWKQQFALIAAFSKLWLMYNSYHI